MGVWTPVAGECSDASTRSWRLGGLAVNAGEAASFVAANAGADFWLNGALSAHIPLVGSQDEASLADDVCAVSMWLSGGGRAAAERGSFQAALEGARRWLAGRAEPAVGGRVVALSNGTRLWFDATGALHRDGAAAVERFNGDRAWYRSGLPHRDDAAAVVRGNGSLEWWRQGARFRVEWRDKAGKLHRETGAAVEDADGRREWWWHGLRFVQEDHVAAPTVLEYELGLHWVWLKTAEARRQERVVMGHDMGPGTFEQWSGDRAMFSLRSGRGVPQATMQLRGLEVEKLLGRDGGPPSASHAKLAAAAAGRIGTRLLLGVRLDDEPRDGRVVVASGDGETTAWIVDGAVHREGKPALVRRRTGEVGVAEKLRVLRTWSWRDGLPDFGGATRVWAVCGRLHRAGAPAVVGADGSREWWRDGVRHRSDGPAVERADGRREWWVRGLRHRDGAPAVVKPDGGRAWWRRGRRHRDDGPAVELPDGKVEFWYDGERYEEEDFYE
jgi:hypothetical protein